MAQKYLGKILGDEKKKAGSSIASDDGTFHQFANYLLWHIQSDVLSFRELIATSQTLLILRLHLLLLHLRPQSLLPHL